MWKSPIEIAEEITKQIDMDFENGIIKAVQKVGIDVDKEELLKALQYDRGQYEKGYQDGLNANKWIPCSERLPEEHDSIFKKFKGTDTWDNAMFESISDEVNVTVEFLDGTRKAETSHTIDGKWSCEKSCVVINKVIAWMPLPEPYKVDMRTSAE